MAPETERRLRAGAAPFLDAVLMLLAERGIDPRTLTEAQYEEMITSQDVEALADRWAPGSPLPRLTPDEVDEILGADYGER